MASGTSGSGNIGGNIGVRLSILTLSGDPSPYNDRGQTLAVNIYDDDADRNDGDIVNQIAYAYDGWGNVATSWQAHNGKVDNDGLKEKVTPITAAESRPSPTDFPGNCQFGQFRTIMHVPGEAESGSAGTQPGKE